MRGTGQQTKVHYKGNEDDFVILVDSAQAVQEWKKDKSVPLAQVMSGWKIFCTHKHGNQGVLDGASNQQLNSEFGTHKEEEVVTQILEKGTVVEGENSARDGNRNITQGPTVAH